MARRSVLGIDDIQPKPRNDAYTVLLTISLLAMIAACVILFYELKRYPSLRPPAGLDRTAVPAATDTSPSQ